MGKRFETDEIASHPEAYPAGACHSGMPRTIAVDLTPILPGGENGGAKIFVLELLRRLAAMAPETRFVLLTQAASHEELGGLDQANVERKLVVGSTGSPSVRSRLDGLAHWVLARCPGGVRMRLSQLLFRCRRAIQAFEARSVLRDIGADVLFCPFTAPTFFEPGIPTVCTIYDCQYKTYPEFFSPEDVAHRDMVFVNACRRATLLTAISNYSRDTAIQYGRLDPARIRTIYLRLAKRFPTERAGNGELLAKYGLESGQYLLYPANFWRHKNHELLLVAFGMACHQGLPAAMRLVCTGAPGERQAYLSQIVGAMGLGNRVVFPGYLPNDDLSALLLHSKGMIFPSLYEGFGLPVLEAMAAGIPVACSDTTSLPEIAAGAAILFDPRRPQQIAAAIGALAGEAGNRAQLVQAGRERAAEFADSDRMAREYWEVLRQALSSAREETVLAGVYSDGWVGPNLLLNVVPAPYARTLELEFSVPGWIPPKNIIVRAYRAGNPLTKPFTVKRNTRTTYCMPLEPSGGEYAVKIFPSFVPVHIGCGDDRRELCLLLDRCSIVEKSERLVLFPSEDSACE